MIIKMQKRQWAGQIERMDNSWIANSERQRVVGLKKHWPNSMDKDSTWLLGFRKWRTHRNGQDAWREFILKAQVYNGLLSPNSNDGASKQLELYRVHLRVVVGHDTSIHPLITKHKPNNIKWSGNDSCLGIVPCCTVSMSIIIPEGPIIVWN